MNKMAPPIAVASQDAHAPSPAGRRRRLLRFWLMAGLCLLIDLASKKIVFGWLAVPEGAGPGGPLGPESGPIIMWVLNGFLRLSGYVNAGAAFGIGEGHPVLINAMAGILLPALVLMAYGARDPGAPIWALGLTLGGALGNLHDRIWMTGVRDFLELVKPWSPDETLWPVFNVADMGIVGGITFYMAWTLFGGRHPGAPDPTARPAGQPDIASSADNSSARGGETDPPPPPPRYISVLA